MNVWAIIFLLLISCENTVPKSLVRLVNGTSLFDGRVEIFYNNTWGTVCYHSFDYRDAQVLCFMRGYDRRGAKAVFYTYGAGTGPIWSHHLHCNGTENSVFDCNGWRSPYLQHCNHDEDAGISCKQNGCLGLPVVNNGKYSNPSCINVTSYFGLTCTLTCDAGFKHLAYNATECLDTGNWSVSSDLLTCGDIDECAENLCGHVCKNTHGSYNCYCNAGYQLGQNNRTCIDIDECVEKPCDQVCRNSEGTYECSCNEGYYLGLDNRTCLDTDECTSNPCGQNCRNTQGTYECFCNTGYKLDKDNKTCIDILECDSNNGGCEHNCTNEIGSFRCGCLSGYMLQNDSFTCNDRNECDIENGGCNHQCFNEEGSYTCLCNQGYQLNSDRLTCTDVNDCDLDNGNCDQLCVNIQGSFFCDCNFGYLREDDNVSCIDRNECAVKNAGCYHICQNTVGSFSCSCLSGYFLQTDNATCEDIDECKVNNGGCEQNCNNLNGTFSCTCFEGYNIQTDNVSCSDKNECDYDNGSCEHFCSNENGTYSCSCRTGFILDTDNTSCRDVDECLDNNGKCQQTCINIQGSFLCSCKKGNALNKDKFTCKNVSTHSVSSSLILQFDSQIFTILLETTAYNAVVEHLTMSLNTVFSNYTSLPFQVVVHQIRNFSELENRSNAVVDYTIVYDEHALPSIRDDLINGILMFTDWAILDYDGEHVMAYIVNGPPVILPPSLLTNLTENSPAGTVVGEFVVTDPDDDVSGEIRVYSDDKPEEIGIGPIINDRVQLVLEGLLDVDKYKNNAKIGTFGPTFEFSIVVTDKPGLTANATISLTAIDINDNYPQCNPSEMTVKIPRDTQVGNEILDLDTVCSDKDYYYDKIEYRMEKDICSAFEINENSALSVKADIPDTLSCSVTIKVADRNNATFSTALSLTIKFLECPPGKDYLNNTWKRGIPGKYTIGTCPIGYSGEVKRLCNIDGVYQEPFYNCTSTEIAEIFEKVLNKNASTSEVLDDLANVTAASSEKTNNLLSGDLEAVNQVMAKITEIIEVKPENVERFTNSFVETANNILDESTTKSWTSKMNQTGSGADTVLENLDRFVEKVANVTTTTGDLKVSKSNLFLKVGSTKGCKEIKFPNRESGDVPNWAEKTSDRVYITCSSNFTSMSYSSVMYRNLSKILPSSVANRSTTTKMTLGAAVMSFSYFPKTERKLDEPIEITFQLYSNSLEDPLCSFWSKNNSSKGSWSSEGCWLDRFINEKNLVICKCDHLTNFAVLMSPSTHMSPDHDVALSVISMVGCILSMICLALTVAIHGFFWRAVKSEKSILNINLSCVLFVAYLLFLSGVNQTENKNLCTAIAVFLHLLFLVVFFIMLSEGLLLANTLLFPFSSRRIGMHLLVGSYVLALVIVAISMGSVKLEGYGGEKSCWLSTSSGLIWAFLVPVLLVIVINLTIVTLVIRTMFSTAGMSKKTDKEKAKAGIRSIVILMPIMGITWLFGIFSVNRDTVTFQYLFALFNSIQGVLIFVFHCVMSKKVQLAFRKEQSRWQTLHSYDVNSSSTHSTKLTKATEESTSAM